jgi:hypothetical protein
MRYLFFLSLIVSSSAFSQIGMGQWRLHVPNRNAVDVDGGNGVVYAAFTNGLLEYAVEDDDKRIWTAVNGLSDISLTSLKYWNNSLFIGYDNGNFDKLSDGRVTNIPAIKLAQIQGSKRINKIVEHGGFIYLATGFAIVKIDPVKNEVKDTYYPTGGNDALLDIAFRNDSIYALSSTRMFRGYLNNLALSDSSQWTIDTRLPFDLNEPYAEIEIVNNDLYLLYKVSGYGADSVFRIDNSSWQLVNQEAFSLEINSLDQYQGALMVNFEGGMLAYNPDLSYAFSATTYSFGEYPSVKNSMVLGDYTWIADSQNGLVRFFNNYSSLNIPFDGPPKNEFYSMDWYDGKLAIAGGGLSSIAPTFSGSGVYTFEDEVWTLHDRDNTLSWGGQPIWDFLSVSIDRKGGEKMAVGTFSEMPLSILGPDGQATNTFTPSNSPLVTSDPAGTWSMVSSVNYDENGNLWVLNAYSDKPLNVYSSDGIWYSYDCGTAAKNRFSKKMVIDYNGNKWFSLDNAGIFGYHDGGTLSDLSDDKYKNLNTGQSTGNLPSNRVNALAIDFDNEIWIGTDNGFAVLYNSEGAFDAGPGEYNAQRIKLEYEGNVEYILGNTSISDIEVDGGNRKWIGTANSGIVLLSADGLEIIEQHTTQNSPLISDNILDLQLDHNTGELFIVTDEGLVSYRTNATYEDPEYNSVTVFPNPARPEFQGPITIQGIRYNSDVKITDIAGNLVYKTTSNGGTATWDGKTVNGDRVQTGVYLIWTAANDGQGRKVGKVLVIH